MFVVAKGVKSDPVRRWHLPERVFFACGACHILAYAFIRRYPDAGFTPIWFKPAPGFTGNHIVAARDDAVFDYHGYSARTAFVAHMRRKAGRWWPGWRCTEIALPPEVLVSETKSRCYDGLWLREPGQFLHDALPRAERYLDRFPPP